MRKEKIKNISLLILETIINIPFAVGHAFLNPYGVYERLEFNGYKIDRFNERLRYLEKKGYIQINKKNNSISITEKGNIKVLENSNDKESDGRWRLLSFDIPETMRAKRDRFRRSIKKIGFRQVQKSLWACPYNKADDVIMAINIYGVSKYTAYFISEKTDIDKLLNKLFKI